MRTIESRAFDHSSLVKQIESSGFAILRGVYSIEWTAACIETLERSLLSHRDAEGVSARDGGVYASRNVLQICPDVREAWRTPRLLEFLFEILGPECGLVRILYFDKPPERTWALPWHKDLTIAVKPGCESAAWGRKPTLRAGVPHVEAPLSVLEQMLTLRIHLDPATSENGPLEVLAGSHRTGKQLVMDDQPETSILTAAGDVLAMRPLLAHCSGKSHPETPLHRRILHLEFAATPHLPDGFAWHDFIPLARID